MSKAFSSVLYYPEIDVPNERWLRNGCLFWDSIATIVPESMNDPYEGDFARELADNGILRPVRVAPDMEEVEALTDSVLDYLTDPAAEPLFSSEGTGKNWARPQSFLEEIRSAKLNGDEGYVALYREKLPYKIRDELSRVLGQTAEPKMLRLPAGFANFYMTLLAARLSDRLGLGLATDSARADHLAVRARRGANSRTTRPRGGQFAATGPRRTLPVDVAPGLMVDLIVKGIDIRRDVSAGEILKFRREHAEELSRVRKQIAVLTGNLVKGTSIEAMRQQIEDRYKDEVKPALASLRQSLRARRWDAIFSGFLKVGFFAAGPTAAAVYAGVPTSVALGSGAGVTAIGSFVAFREQRRQLRESNPYSYLLSLEQKFRMN